MMKMDIGPVLKNLDDGYLEVFIEILEKITGTSITVADKYGNFIKTSRMEKDVFETGAVESLLKQATEVFARKDAVRELSPIYQIICQKCGRKAYISPIVWKEELLGFWMIYDVALAGGADGEDVIYIENHACKESPEMIPDGMPPYPEHKLKLLMALVRALSGFFIQLAQKVTRTLERNGEFRKLSLDALMKFTNLSDLGVYIMDFYSGDLILVSDSIRHFFNLDDEKLKNMKCWQLTAPSLDTFCSFCPRYKIIDKDGVLGAPYVWENYHALSGKWFRFTSQAVKWFDGRLAHMVTFTDITSFKTIQAQLEGAIYTDKELNLPNHLRLSLDIEGFSGEEDFYVLFFDIQALRNINDVYGRAAGDQLLKSISRFVQGLEIAGAKFYRIDGDAFCLMMEHVSLEEAKQVANEIYQRFDEVWQFDCDGKFYNIFCNITMGLALGNKALEENDNILNLMERTLSVAKSKRGVVVYNEEMDRTFKEQLKLEQSLKNCVRNGMEGFSVCYQPIVEPLTGKWTSLEALCRWKSPEVGEVPPGIFIQAAEQMGFVGTIDEWVLETALRQCKQWGLDKNDQFILDVNISPLHFTDETLGTSITAALNRHNYPPEKLSLEITESIKLNFNDTTINAIDRLTKTNVKVALDDFGTGYSSFNNLKNIPVSILKTEKVFIDNIENDTYLQYLLYLMVELAHAADMKIIVEGVETEKQLEIMMKNSVDYLQGYLFSKPLTPAGIEEQMENFYKTEGGYNLRCTNIDYESIMNSGFSYALSPELYRVLHYCIQTLVYGDNYDASFKEVLQRLGQELKISGASIYFYDNGSRSGSVYQMHYGDSAQYSGEDKKLLELIKTVSGQGMIMAANVSFLQKPFRKIFMERGIKSLVVIPFKDESGFIGMFCAVEKRYYREWAKEEILILNNLSAIISSIVKKYRLQREILKQKDIYEMLLNSIDIVVFVSDVETYEILFANSKAKRIFGEDKFVPGAKCHKIFFGEENICECCSVPKLIAEDKQQYNLKESYNTIANAHYKIYDTIIQWSDNKLAHLGYFVDITTLKEYEMQFESFGVRDAWSDVFSSRALISIMSTLLRDAYLLDATVSICFLDFDRIRLVNQLYGWKKGNHFIGQAVELIKKRLDKEDVIGRYISDKFIILMPGYEKAEAYEIMSRIRKDVGQTEIDGYRCSFSFGIVENNEVRYKADDSHVHQIINMAQSRMQEYKRMVGVSITRDTEELEKRDSL